MEQILWFLGAFFMTLFIAHFFIKNRRNLGILGSLKMAKFMGHFMGQKWSLGQKSVPFLIREIFKSTFFVIFRPKSGPMGQKSVP